MDNDRLNNLLASVDALTHCAHCGSKLDSRSPSGDFCKESCARMWRATDAPNPDIVTRPAEVDERVRRSVADATSDVDLDALREWARSRLIRSITVDEGAELPPTDHADALVRTLVRADSRTREIRRADPEQLIQQSARVRRLRDDFYNYTVHIQRLSELTQEVSCRLDEMSARAAELERCTPSEQCLPAVTDD